MEEDAKLLNGLFQRALKARRAAAMLMAKGITLPNLENQLTELEAILQERAEVLPDLTAYCGILLLKYPDEPSKGVSERMAAAALAMSESLDKEIRQAMDNLLDSSIRQLLDASFDKFIQIQEAYSQLYLEERLVDGLSRFVLTAADSDVRVSVYSLQHNDPVSLTPMQRYKTILAKLKRHTRLSGAVSKNIESYAKAFEFELFCTRPDSIPTECLIHTRSDLESNRDHLPVAFMQPDPPVKLGVYGAVYSSPSHGRLDSTPKPDPDPTEDEDEFFPVNLHIVKSLIGNKQVNFLPRLLHLMLSQVQAKSVEARDWTSLNQVYESGFMPILTLLANTAVKAYFEGEPILKEQILQRLANLMYSVGLLLIDQATGDNEVALYSIVNCLFQMDTQIKQTFLEFDTRVKFFKLPLNSIYAMVFKKFVSQLREKASFMFNLHLKNGTDNFKKLDIFNLNLAAIMAPLFEARMIDKEFYRPYKASLESKAFFNQMTAKQHYMVPFQFVLPMIDKSSLGSAIWATKAILYELLVWLIKRKNYMTFAGFLALMLNVNAFAIHVAGILNEPPLQAHFNEMRKNSVVARSPPAIHRVGLSTASMMTIGELRLLRHHFQRFATGVGSQAPRKQSSVYAVNRHLVHTEVNNSIQAFAYQNFVSIMQSDRLDPSALNFSMELYLDNTVYSE